jgi:CHAT domain-containing protein
VCAQAGDLDRAAECLSRAGAVFEAWFAGASRDAFRVSMADDGSARDLYTMGASVALKQHRTADAFALTDRLRSLAVTELLRDAAAGGTGRSDQLMAVRQWSRASADWTGAYDLLAAAGYGGDVEAIGAAQACLDEAQVLLEAAERRLEAAVPRYLLGGRRTATPPLRLDEVRPLVPDGAVLLEYLVGWDRVLIWAVDRHGAVGQEVSVETARMSGLVRRFHGFCARSRSVADPWHDAASLAELLLDPVRDAIRDHERLIVVPSGPLHLLPFHVLPFEGAHLGATRTISVLPAAAVLPFTAGRSRPAIDRGALVVGDPAYGPGRGLRRLPGTLVEAQQVATCYGIGALTGPEADEARVAAGTQHAAVIHLATHGLVSAVAPTTSSVALAGTDKLTVADLMGLEIDADLVVLSACDTGRGEVTLGGDVVGLVRGLLAAGARGAVVSLWPVDDEATCVLMDRFAQLLREGQPAADALAAARREIRALDAEGRAAAYAGLSRAETVPAPSGQQRAARDTLLAEQSDVDSGHPYWWAPFIHIGV